MACIHVDGRQQYWFRFWYRGSLAIIGVGYYRGKPGALFPGSIEISEEGAVGQSFESRFSGERMNDGNGDAILQTSRRGEGKLESKGSAIKNEDSVSRSDSDGKSYPVISGGSCLRHGS